MNPYLAEERQYIQTTRQVRRIVPILPYTDFGFKRNGKLIEMWCNGWDIKSLCKVFYLTPEYVEKIIVMIYFGDAPFKNPEILKIMSKV